MAQFFQHKNQKKKIENEARNYRLKLIKKLKQLQLYGPHLDLDLIKLLKKEIIKYI